MALSAELIGDILSLNSNGQRERGPRPRIIRPMKRLLY